MKKFLIGLFYLAAFAAVSYFLWEYVNVPKAFILSLIISLAIILILVWQKSAYIKTIGITLIVIHVIWLIGYFIPVYNEQPDIRQWYRRNPTTLRSIPSDIPSTVTLEANGQTISFPASSLTTPRPLYQGNRIRVAGASIQSGERALIGFRDGSNVQILPQSLITLETVSPDFSALTGSRIGMMLEEGIISMHTRRTSRTPNNWYVKAGAISFSCNDCIIALSALRGTIYSNQDFVRWLNASDNSEKITLSGGTYNFTQSSVSRAANPQLVALAPSTELASDNRQRSYNALRQRFITDQRGRSMDSSFLLNQVSKVKMAIVGIFDWTYREKYNNLMLYEYLRGNLTDLPPPFENQRAIYEFIK